MQIDDFCQVCCFRCFTATKGTDSAFMRVYLRVSLLLLLQVIAVNCCDQKLILGVKSSLLTDAVTGFFNTRWMGALFTTSSYSI